MLRLYILQEYGLLIKFSSFDKILVHLKLQFKMNKYFIKTRKSIKTQEQEVVYFGKIVPSNNTVM